MTKDFHPRQALDKPVRLSPYTYRQGCAQAGWVDVYEWLEKGFAVSSITLPSCRSMMRREQEEARRAAQP